MFKQKLKRAYLFGAVGATLAMVGCKKENGLPDTHASVSTEAIRNEKGILVFKDKETFDSTLQKLSLMTREEADKWEKDFHFTSQRNIFNKIADAENEYDEYALKKTPEEIQAMPEHCDLYFHYFKNGLIKEENGTYNYSIFSGSYACVVNEQGLVAIDKTIIYLTDKEVKKITDGDFNKISLLKSTQKTDTSNNIVVNTIDVSSALRGMFNWSRSSGWVSSGNCNNCKRISMSVTFSSDLSGGGSSGVDRYDVNVQCQQRNSFGNWKYVFTTTTINGSWRTYQRYTTGVTNIFNPTYYYSNSINNFWTSVNPTTGAGAPHQTSFVYSAGATTFWYEDEISPATWNAKRDGGCCGLTANANK
jgi:hypothetical protein